MSVACDCSHSWADHRWRPGAWMLAGLLVLGLWPSWVHGFTVHVSSKARSHISEFVKDIPVTHDVLGKMTDSMRMQWSHDLGLTINQTIDFVKAPVVPITVDVKLVGFNGDGNEGLVVQDHDLLVFLKSLHNQLDTVALHPEPNHLAIKPEFDFRVMPVYYELGHKVQSAIEQAISTIPASTTWTSYPMHLISAATIDHVLEDDFKQTADSSTYTIYILNPKISQTYAYVYEDNGATCPGNLYVGSQRYAWFDLSANVTFYGPGPGGKGHVFTHSVPVLKHYKPDSMSRAVLPDLAALVWSACQHLIWPPLHHADLHFKPKVSIHVITMHEGLVAHQTGFHTQLMEDELVKAVGDVQHISITEHFISFSNCDHCVTAYASALKSRTSRAPDKKGFVMSVNQYLDVRELERWFGEWRESILAAAGINFSEGDPELIVPVFVLDLPTKDPILLDGWRQAAALDSGDVVAVRTEAEPVATFFGCYEQQMKVNPKDIYRPVLASILQVAWGVSDTALYWSQATGRGWNFLWSVSSTPFGVLAGGYSLSFAQKDAMLRNAALAAMNGTVEHSLLLLEGYNTLSGYAGESSHVKNFLLPEQVIPYHQRMSLLLFKLQEACTSMSKLKLPLAIGFAQSSGHDAGALRKLTRRLRKSMELDLVCVGEENMLYWWAVPIVSAALAATLFTWRIARGSGSDEVQAPGAPRMMSGSGLRSMSRSGSAF